MDNLPSEIAQIHLFFSIHWSFKLQRGSFPYSKGCLNIEFSKIFNGKACFLSAAARGTVLFLHLCPGGSYSFMFLPNILAPTFHKPLTHPLPPPTPPHHTMGRRQGNPFTSVGQKQILKTGQKYFFGSSRH